MNTRLFTLIDELADEKSKVFLNMNGMMLLAQVAISQLEVSNIDVKDMKQQWEKFSGEEYKNFITG